MSDVCTQNSAAVPHPPAPFDDMAQKLGGARNCSKVSLVFVVVLEVFSVGGGIALAVLTFGFAMIPFSPILLGGIVACGGSATMLVVPLSTSAIAVHRERKAEEAARIARQNASELQQRLHEQTNQLETEKKVNAALISSGSNAAAAGASSDPALAAPAQDDSGFAFLQELVIKDLSEKILTRGRSVPLTEEFLWFLTETSRGKELAPRYLTTSDGCRSGDPIRLLTFDLSDEAIRDRVTALWASMSSAEKTSVLNAGVCLCSASTSAPVSLREALLDPKKHRIKHREELVAIVGATLYGDSAGLKYLADLIKNKNSFSTDINRMRTDREVMRKNGELLLAKIEVMVRTEEGVNVSRINKFLTDEAGFAPLAGVLSLGKGAVSLLREWLGRVFKTRDDWFKLMSQANVFPGHRTELCLFQWLLCVFPKEIVSNDMVFELFPKSCPDEPGNIGVRECVVSHAKIFEDSVKGNRNSEVPCPDGVERGSDRDPLRFLFGRGLDEITVDSTSI
ncbi:MAG: hypothetical protein LBF24_01910 [Puniceicoccales bacterium]|jgi:hypothetical protein|nr:hypothetical protein [Puniceicoccales bacterium]